MDPEHLTSEESRKHSNPMPEPLHLAPFNVKEQRLESGSFSDDRASHPNSKGEPRHPAEETHLDFNPEYTKMCGWDLKSICVESNHLLLKC